MYRRQDQVILVEVRVPGQVARSARRIQRQFCQEPFPGRITARDLFKLFQIRLPCFEAVVKTFEMRLVPAACLAQLRLPTLVCRFG